MRPRFSEKAADRTALTQSQFIKLLNQITVHGNGPLSSLRRRWGARIRHQIDQRPIGFVTNGRDQRYAAFGGGANDDLFVEAPQVFKAATTAGND